MLTQVMRGLQGILGGIRAAQEGHQVIMTPTSNCYFDYRQSLRYDAILLLAFGFQGMGKIISPTGSSP